MSKIKSRNQHKELKIARISNSALKTQIKNAICFDNHSVTLLYVHNELFVFNKCFTESIARFVTS